jgi:hypothetical protein
MSTKDRGFGSASKSRRKELSRKGGQAAHATGKAHEFTSEEGAAAAMIGVERRKLRQANVAALHLIKKGFDIAELHALQMSLDEYLYYGGAKSNAERLHELRKRIHPLRDVDAGVYQISDEVGDNRHE